MTSSAPTTSFARPTDSKRIISIQVYQAKFSSGSGIRSSSSGIAGSSNSTGSSGVVLSFLASKKNTKHSKKKASNASFFTNIRFYNIFFLVLYIIQGGWVISTIGKPYKEFLLKAEQKGYGTSILIGTTKYRAELEFAYQDLNDVNRRTKKIGYMDWMDMDIETLAAEKKKDKQRSVLDSIPKSMRVPHIYQTSFWSTLCLGVTAVLHALLLLLQYWFVSFNIFMNYREIDATTALHKLPKNFFDVSPEEEELNATATTTSSSNTDKKDPKQQQSTKSKTNSKVVFDDREIVHGLPSYLPTHARIVPAASSVTAAAAAAMGQSQQDQLRQEQQSRHHVLVPIQYYPVLGMTIEYHRRRYYYNVQTQCWNKIRCRTNFPISFLTKEWYGFPSYQEMIAGQIRFGPNLFQVRNPTFLELYKKQLLNPFAVFQIFCVLLWAIDDYLIYSFFSLFMVLLFEGTVVFQRIKSLQALTNMGNKSRTVYVYRYNRWSAIDSTELLPGDIMSLTRVAPHRAKQPDIDKTKDTDAEKNKKKRLMINMIQDEGGDVVPADLLLLRGSTVVNEASLTGESVPQMKEGLSIVVPSSSSTTDANGSTTNSTNDEEDELLSIKVHHKMNVVYAGTKMLQCKGTTDYLDNDASPSSADNNNNHPTTKQDTNEMMQQQQQCNKIPSPPDQGCVCFVLRTGFASAQGKLVRMIEGSQENVKGHERETGLLLLLLCVFAIISSSYVLYHGIQNENRSKYELLLHCILIVTNVIRPELPMQMAMAVNNSLMTLLKLHIYCTEPYRVPIAGKINICLFDKTGTLTTDELVAVGVYEPTKLGIPIDQLLNDGVKFLTPMSKLYQETAASLVLAGCHSLVVYEDETTGDPLESAALKSMRWHISVSTGNAEPAPARGKSIPPGEAIQLHGETITNIHVVTRHHFSSKLQRMSCVIQTNSGKKYAVAKGSPEAIGKLLAEKPPGYDEKADYLSKQGYRVIGLAYKQLATTADAKAATETRIACETNLTFAGFIAFTCMVRKDTAGVLKRLKEGGMGVAMVTGDALLTAIHVAKEVNICESIGESDQELNDDRVVQNEELRALLESKRQTKQKSKKQKPSRRQFKQIAYLDTDDDEKLFWRNYDDDKVVEYFVAQNMPALSKNYELAMTGKRLEQAYVDDPETRKYLQHVKVFARMTPVAKESVIESLHSVGLMCMMCGDGANDVGALKQSDVGVALLTGFSNINVAKLDDDQKDKKKDTTNEVTAIMSQQHLNEIRALPVILIKMKIRQMGMEPDKFPEIIDKDDLIKLYQIAAREAAVKKHNEKNALAKAGKKTKEELAAEKKAETEYMQRRLIERTQELEAQGVSFAQFRAMKDVVVEINEKKKRENPNLPGVTGSAATLASQLDELGETSGLPMIKLGDASIAAPFTSKMPSIRNCVDIVRQGRCTLVSSMQMYQIMALQCLISSYSLSVLYLDGVKYGDAQMTAMGLLGSVSFMSVSRSKPLDKLSRVQPLNSIFHLASFTSLLGQFAIHLATMVIAVQSAKSHLPPDYQPELDGQFSPGILNTVVFLVSSVQQVTVFFVNLQGYPFMTGISENRPLLWSLASTFILVFMFASESVPQMNRYFQLVAFPDDAFRNFILMILGLDLIGTYLFDRLMRFIFAREILIESIKGTTSKDIFTFVRTFVIVGGLMKYFMGKEETWTELMAMEEALLRGMNATVANSTECINGICDAAQETVESAAAYVSDEF